jgi:hypothetical protein
LCSSSALHLCSSSRQIDTVIFFFLRNYEMKEEMYCFVIFRIAKYGRFNIIIGRNIASCGTVSSRTKHLFSSQTRIIKTIFFIRDERDSTIGNLSLDYDTKCSVFGSHEIYETIYFRFRFIITQDYKNPRVKDKFMFPPLKMLLHSKCFDAFRAACIYRARRLTAQRRPMALHF